MPQFYSVYVWSRHLSYPSPFPPKEAIPSLNTRKVVDDLNVRSGAVRVAPAQVTMKTLSVRKEIRNHFIHPLPCEELGALFLVVAMVEVGYAVQSLYINHYSSTFVTHYAWKSFFGLYSTDFRTLKSCTL